MARHPEHDLIPYLRGELDADERARVAAHLGGCAPCRRTLDDSAAVLEHLAASLPAAPEPDWARYQAAVRARLAPGTRWWRRPLPLAISAAVAAALVLVAIEIDVQRVTPNGDAALLEDAALATRIELLEQYGVVERLELLEDMDVIRGLDTLPVSRGG